MIPTVTAVGLSISPLIFALLQLFSGCEKKTFLVLAQNGQIWLQFPWFPRECKYFLYNMYK